MAISPAIKLLQIFAGLGTVATTPFAMKLANKPKITDLRRDARKVTGGDETPRREEKKEEPVKKDNGNAMDKAVEMMIQGGGEESKGDRRGCFWVPSLFPILFFCFNVDKLDSLFLFHFDKSAGSTLEERLKRIESITTKWPTTINFANGEKKQMNSRLRPPLAKVLKGPSFTPNKDCRIEQIEKQSNQKDYKLICNTTSSNESRDAWEKNISHLAVHIPELKLQDRIRT